jgi:hypothetical protein
MVPIIPAAGLRAGEIIGKSILSGGIDGARGQRLRIPEEARRGFFDA